MNDVSALEGWYPDPRDPALLRWWDGQAWSDDVLPHPGEPSDATKRGRAKAVVLAAGGVLATLVTAATIVIPIISDTAERRTSVQTLDTVDDEEPLTLLAPTEAPVPAVAALEPYTDLTLEHTDPVWYDGTIAFDAPFTEFLVGTEEYCDATASAGLVAHGVPDELTTEIAGEPVRLFMELLRNTATTGGAIAVDNLRVDGEFVEQEVPRLSISCVRGGEGGAAQPVFARATFGDDSPAVFAEDPWGGSGTEGLPAIGTPFSANLAPGEYLELDLIIDGVDVTRDFVGRVTMEVHSGDDTKLAVIEEGWLQTSLPRIADLHVLIGHGAIYCLPDATLVDDHVFVGQDVSAIAQYRCTPTELSALASAAAERLR